MKSDELRQVQQDLCDLWQARRFVRPEDYDILRYILLARAMLKREIAKGTQA